MGGSEKGEKAAVIIDDSNEPLITVEGMKDVVFLE